MKSPQLKQQPRNSSSTSQEPRFLVLIKKFLAPLTKKPCSSQDLTISVTHWTKFASILIEWGKPPTVDTIESLNEHAYILGKSKHLETASSLGVVCPLAISSLVKICDYFWGTRSLFNIMSDVVFNEKFWNLQVISIPPPSDRPVVLESKWFHTLQCIYFKETHRLPDISPQRIVGNYGSLINKYNNEMTFAYQGATWKMETLCSDTNWPISHQIIH